MSKQFTVVPRAIFRDPRLSPAMVMTLGVLCDYANKDGWCWPRLATLAKELRVQKPAVSKMLARLRDAGFVEVHYEMRDGRRCCLYRVIFDRPLSTAAAIPAAELEDAEDSVDFAPPPESARFLHGNDRFPDGNSSTRFPEGNTETARFHPEGNGIYELPKELPKLLPPADAGGPGVAEVLAIWNAMAADAKLPKARETAKRRRDIARRLQDAGWLEDFRAACAVIANSPWHRGANDRGWRADLDFLLRPDKATTLAERASAPAVAPVPSAGTLEEFDVGGGQRMSASVFWRVCTDAGLAAPMQTADMIREGVERLHARGTVQDPHAFTSLVLHVNPAKLAEVKFGKERETQLRARLASWRRMAGAA